MLLSVVRMSAVLALALATLPLLRGRSAALRARVIGTGLAAAACVPLLQLIAPAWGVRLAAAAHLGAGASPAGLPVAVWLAGAAAHLVVLLIGMFRLMGVAAAADPIREGY